MKIKPLHCQLTERQRSLLERCSAHDDKKFTAYIVGLIERDAKRKGFL